MQRASERANFFKIMAMQMRRGLCQLSETLRFARRRRCIANGVSAQRRPFESLCSSIGEPWCCTFGEPRCLTSASRCALTSASRSVLTSASRCVLTSASRGVLTSASRCVHGHRSAASASHCSELVLALRARQSSSSSSQCCHRRACPLGTAREMSTVASVPDKVTPPPLC